MGKTNLQLKFRKNPDLPLNNIVKTSLPKSMQNPIYLWVSHLVLNLIAPAFLIRLSEPISMNVLVVFFFFFFFFFFFVIV